MSVTVGTVEGSRTSCPTQSSGRAIIRARSRSSSSREHRPGTTGWIPATGRTGRRMSSSRHASTWLREARRPHHQLSGPRRVSSSPSSGRANSPRSAVSAGFSRRPLPSGLSTATRPLRTASTRPGTPRREPGRSSTGSHHWSSTRRRITSTASRPVSDRSQTLLFSTSRSRPSTSGMPRYEARYACSKYVSLAGPGVRMTARGSSTPSGAARLTPARMARKKPASRSTPEARCSVGRTRDRAERLTSA